MKKFLFLLIFISIVFGSFSQIVINQNDMPNVGDTIRFNTTYNLGAIDYTLTGPGYNWDYSSLSTILPQNADTFVHVWNTPLLYQIVFLYPFVSTIAQPQADFDLIPNLTLSDVYKYYKESSSEFKEVGTGFTVNGIPLPFKYDEDDIIYRFPLEFGDSDSSTSSFSINIPGLGYYGSVKKRVNFVDGWGTLTTPFGTFEVLRMKTVINQHDSIYIDTLNFGLPINTETIEYKWLGKTFGRPLLKISKTGFLPAVAEYIYSEIEPLVVSLGPDINTCPGEEVVIHADITGGTPPYYKFWSNFSFGDSISVAPNTTTDYWILVMDSQFRFTRDTVTVAVNDPPLVDAGPDQTITATTYTTLNPIVTGGTPPYTYEWSPVTGLSDPFSATPFASPMITTTYSLTVTDSYGCQGSDQVTIQVTQVPVYTLSGNVNHAITNQGVPDINIDFTGLLPVKTDMNGEYSKAVYEGWDGRSKPSSDVFSFEPDSIQYSNVYSNFTGQDFTAYPVIPPSWFISGNITDQGTGTPSTNVAVEFTGLSPAMTDANGFYKKNVPDNWTGSATPVGFNFSPESRTYTNVNADLTMQDYVRLAGGLPPGWEFNTTSNTHTIAVPVSSTPKVYGQNIAVGDWIGVFYINSEGKEACGGALQWTGAAIASLTAYGDDTGTPFKDGFAQLENLTWKIYTWSNYSEYYAVATYLWIFTNDGKFHSGAYSMLTSLLVTTRSFDVRVFLEGPFNTDHLNTTLNSSNYLPLNQPYTAAPWNYSGTESVSMIPDPNVVDWILLEIRQTAGGPSSATSSTVAARKAALLLSDGRIKDMNGASLPQINYNFTQNIYPVVYHRNHLAVMGNEPMAMQYGKYSLDFTLDPQASYNGTLAVKSTGYYWSMRSGDGNGNGQVNNTDKNLIWESQTGSSGYFSGDFNLDGSVNNVDKLSFWKPNSGFGTQVPY